MGRTRSDLGPRIVEAARGRFLREGVDGASLRAIAADAGTSIGMVYYYFPTKDDLFFAVVEETYQHVLEDLVRACETPVPRDRIRNIYARIGRIDEHESEVIRLVIREVLVSSDRLQRLFARFQRGHLPVVLRALADGAKEGSIRSDLPPMLLLPIVAAVGIVPQFVLKQLAPALAGDLAETLVGLLYEGISPPGKSPTRTRSRARGRGTRGS